jgi:hypothetical protein
VPSLHVSAKHAAAPTFTTGLRAGRFGPPSVGAVVVDGQPWSARESRRWGIVSPRGRSGHLADVVVAVTTPQARIAQAGTHTVSTAFTSMLAVRSAQWTAAHVVLVGVPLWNDPVAPVGVFPVLADPLA